VAAENPVPHPIPIELAFGLPDEQLLLAFEVPEGCTVAGAVQLALAEHGLGARFPQVDFSACRTGIWSRQVSGEQPLQAGDRIELYRPLQADPKDARRARAAKKQ
jgi:putative ubiquitin-RnfH superfamily antitoxin RatB of RatAB toxin-antitoxin module